MISIHKAFALKRVLAVALVAAVFAVFAAAGTALAFEPPADPQDVFTGGGAAGHPGSNGQATAMGTGNTRAAWNAHDNSGQIGN